MLGGWPKTRLALGNLDGLPVRRSSVGNLSGLPKMVAYDLMIRRTVGLTAYWPMDDAQGSTVRDLSATGKTLTKTGTVTQQADCLVPRYRTSSWAGGTNYFSAATVVQNVLDNWTLEAWLSCDLPRQSGIVFIGTDSSNGYGMSIGSTYGSSKQPVVLLGGVVWAGFFLPSGAGYELPGLSFTGHMAVVRRSGTLYCYINGIQVGVGVTNTPNAPSGSNIVGRVGGANNMPWVGRLGHVAVYNVALSTSQLLARYRAGMTGWAEGE